VGLDAADAVLLRPGEGETIFDGPERTIRILADRNDLALTWFRLDPGQEGPEPHVHRRHADAFYVLEGELEFGMGPEVTRLSGAAGSLAAAPPNVVHTFRNGSDGTVVFLNIHAPSMGFAEMLRAARDGRDEDAGQFDQFEPPADGGRPLSDAVLRGAGEGESITIDESPAVLKTDGPDVGGFFSLAERLLAPGFHGPALKRDGAFVAAFYILDGTLSLQFRGEQVDAAPGALGLVSLPSVLTFANTSAELVRVLEVTAPAQPAAR
jgi:mannose-6-phosphate isomerase-like protein (cupin superfamily)